MKFNSDQERNDVIARLTLITLAIVISINLIIMLAGYFISQNMSIGQAANAKMLRNILLLLTMGELAAIYVVKRSLMKRLDNIALYTPEIYNQLHTINIVIAALCTSISIYGLVALILGNKYEELMFFVALSLIGYQIFRLRARDFER